MGLKSKLNKMKNFLFDEEEIEKPEKKNKNKRVEEVIVEKKDEEVKEFDDFYFDDISEPEINDTKEVKSRMTKENDFKFPEFDDDDFMTPIRKEPEIKIEKQEDVKPILYQGSKRREETKKFKPSPIISPIYGLLDQDGNKIKPDIKKSDIPLKNKEDITFDEIRKKAYGSLDDEFENTISKLSRKTIEEAEKDMEEEEKEMLSKSSDDNEEAYVSDLEVSINEEDMVLPRVDFKEIDIDKEHINKKEDKRSQIDDEDDEDTKEQDLFNLIDTIYSGEENDK